MNLHLRGRETERGGAISRHSKQRTQIRNVDTSISQNSINKKKNKRKDVDMSITEDVIDAFNISCQELATFSCSVCFRFILKFKFVSFYLKVHCGS